MKFWVIKSDKTPCHLYRAESREQAMTMFLDGMAPDSIDAVVRHNPTFICVEVKDMNTLLAYLPDDDTRPNQWQIVKDEGF